MKNNEVASVLEELRVTTRHLRRDVNAKSLDLDQMEKAVAERERSVKRLSRLTQRQPDAFTREDVEELQRIHAEGKRAAESLMDFRRQKWTTARELNKQDFVMKTFLRYGAP
jgi:uncharacterized protein YoxC